MHPHQKHMIINKRLKLIRLENMKHRQSWNGVFRLRDFIFSKDSSCLLPDTKDHKKLRLYGNLKLIKRITCLEHDLYNKLYIYHLEEKNPLNIHNGLEQLNEFNSWLLSLKNEKASCFMQAIDTWRKNKRKMMLLANEQVQDNVNRTYVKKIDPEIMEFINSCP